MGKRQFLTVRKKRCQERDAIQGKREEKKVRIAEARALKHVNGGPTKGENGELTMDSSTMNSHQQIDIRQESMDPEWRDWLCEWNAG